MRKGNASGSEKKRYLDVMTSRPSGAAFGKSYESHTTLAVEPVVIPDLEHLSVDDSIEVYDDCAFYPTGYKNVNMKNTMEETVRKYTRPAHLTKIKRSSTILTKKPPKKQLDPSMPVQPKCYTRNDRDNKNIERLFNRKLEQERKLRSTITPEF